jgi:hypothetical protein
MAATDSAESPCTIKLPALASSLILSKEKANKATAEMSVKAMPRVLVFIGSSRDLRTIRL